MTTLTFWMTLLMKELRKVLRDHPVIERIERTGYPNVIKQPEHSGTDYFGDEVLEGDDIVEYDGEVVLKENLEKFLSEMGFEFKTAM
jgi:Hypothetical protein Yqai